MLFPVSVMRASAGQIKTGLIDSVAHFFFIHLSLGDSCQAKINQKQINERDQQKVTGNLSCRIRGQKVLLAEATKTRSQNMYTLSRTFPVYSRYNMTDDRVHLMLTRFEMLAHSGLSSHLQGSTKEVKAEVQSHE